MTLYRSLHQVRQALQGSRARRVRLLPRDPLLRVEAVHGRGDHELARVPPRRARPVGCAAGRLEGREDAASPP